MKEKRISYLADILTVPFYHQNQEPLSRLISISQSAVGREVSGNEINMLDVMFTKGAFHLLELASPKELVLIGVNGKVKAGPRDCSRNPCVEYTQELM